MSNYENYRTQVNFIKKYRAAMNAASGSEVDANANVENKNVATLAGELPKRSFIGTNRLLMFDKLNELYGQDVAQEYIRWIESHEGYKHDETSIFPYCVSITMYPFLFNGLADIGGVSRAPTNLQAFCGSFINLVFAVAAQFAGAVATPEFLTYLDYFIRLEFGDDYWKRPNEVVYKTNNPGKRLKAEGSLGRTIDKIITDYMEQVVYSMNQPAAARNSQSVFWNIAYFDKPYFEGIFEGFVFPDGSTPQWDSVSWLQKRFMKWFNDERTKSILTFPVETANLLNDGKDYVDQEWFDFVCEMYAEGHSFFTYTSDSVDSLASCCFDGSQRCYVKLENGGKISISFKDLYDSNEKNIKVFTDDGFKDCELIRVHKKPLLKIETEQSQIIIATIDHIFPTKNGDKFAKDLTLDDSLVDHYTTKNRYVKIKSIQPYETDSKYVYCFTMKDQSNPYFVLANGIKVHNCRLKNGITDNTFSYTLGAGGISTGSKSVMTMNLNRLVQNLAREKGEISLDDISEAIREQVRKIHKYQIAFNEIMKDNQKGGLLPVYDAGFISLEKQYLTLGIQGFPEAAEFLGIDISPNDEYFAFGEAVLKPIYEENKAARTDELMFNTEFVPAENLGVKNAKWDKKDGYVVPRDCYNSYFYKVEDETCSITDKFILHGDKLTKYLDGGSALHCNLDEHLSKEQYKKLLRFAIKTGCSYFTFNVPNTICNDCGHISKHYIKQCPKCGSENVDYATRVIGYLKRISKYSEGRIKEAKRRYYANAEV